MKARTHKTVFFGLLAMLLGLTAGAQAKLKVCVTTPDLGSLVQEMGGDAIDTVVFAKGSEDPHFIDARPNFIRELSQADLFVETGLELEIGWVPVLLQNARNDKILPGAKGFVDASQAISPLDLPTGPVDRSMGDVHPLGNPHYLADPLSGLKVARLISQRLAALDGEHAARYEQNFQTFRKKLLAAMVGQKLAQKYDGEKLALLYQRGKLESFLKKQGDLDLLDGWLGKLLPFEGAKVVADHNLWPYFARTFGIQVIGFLEPKPGVSPSTKHLQDLISLMKEEGVKTILSVPYFDPRHAQFVAAQTGAKVAEMAHLPGALPNTETYLDWVSHNVESLASALAGGGK